MNHLAIGRILAMVAVGFVAGFFAGTAEHMSAHPVPADAQVGVLLAALQAAFVAGALKGAGAAALALTGSLVRTDRGTPVSGLKAPAEPIAQEQSLAVEMGAEFTRQLGGAIAQALAPHVKPNQETKP